MPSVLLSNSHGYGFLWPQPCLVCRFRKYRETRAPLVLFLAWFKDNTSCDKKYRNCTWGEIVLEARPGSWRLTIFCLVFGGTCCWSLSWESPLPLLQKSLVDCDGLPVTSGLRCGTSQRPSKQRTGTPDREQVWSLKQFFGAFLD